MDIKDMVSPSEAARLGGVSRFTVSNWFDAGLVAGQRTPLGRLVSASDVIRFSAERKATTNRRNGE